MIPTALLADHQVCRVAQARDHRTTKHILCYCPTNPDTYPHGSDSVCSRIEHLPVTCIKWSRRQQMRRCLAACPHHCLAQRT
ncbi:hypothetical protein AV530_012916 [Patagioenas fasciata monilis]|uniref:Uncharacterized protein n=1 Tax=Patagioenas fasciata monilis TaxID=372326 RepID=A0A1V4JAM2_PATFA|nr:hypothetical protein AV530_012916 [Patagioenas fasciata monilis]